MSALVELDAVWKIYPHKAADVVALQNITLQVHEGEFLALIGPSGSGKSTLMHLIGCLDRPTRGDLKIARHSVSRKNDEHLSQLRAEWMGFVFQAFHLIPQLTVLENVCLPMQYRSGGTHEQAKKTLERLGLVHRMDHFPSELSGGEKQRVAIARALSGDPKIILADEPTGNLDSETGEATMEIFEQLNQEGKTIILVTHDPFISNRCRRVVSLKDGQL